MLLQLNKINMTKIKGLHRFDATINNMLLHIVVVSLIGGGNRRASYIKSYRVIVESGIKHHNSKPYPLFKAR
jgi:hypothetical protein